MTNADHHLRAWVDQTLRPVLREMLRDELADILPNFKPDAPTDEIGGIELARQVTRLSAARIYTLVSERKLPHKKRGNRLTFRRSELLNWLDEGNRAEHKPDFDI